MVFRKQQFNLVLIVAFLFAQLPNTAPKNPGVNRGLVFLSAKISSTKRQEEHGV